MMEHLAQLWKVEKARSEASTVVSYLEGLFDLGVALLNVVSQAAIVTDPPYPHSLRLS